MTKQQQKLMRRIKAAEKEVERLEKQQEQVQAQIRKLSHLNDSLDEQIDAAEDKLEELYGHEVMTDKKILEVTRRYFNTFRAQFEAESLDSVYEVVVQKLVISRIAEDAEMGMGELETDEAKKAKQKIALLTAKAVQL